MRSAINYIKKIINFHFDPLPRRYLRRLQHVRSQPFDLSTGKKVYLFLSADYNNLGDVAITLAQRELLQRFFPNHHVVEVPTKIHFSHLKYLLEHICEEDVVTFTGGGNMGSNYYHFQCLRECILHFLPRNMKIYSFPQTIDFSTDFAGRIALKNCKKTYNSCENLILMAREKNSYNFFRTNFKSETVLTPDIVMTLKRWQQRANVRKGIGFALRQDRERIISNAVAKQLNDIFRNYPVEPIDTVLNTVNWSEDAKYMILDKFLENLSQKELLVTDRLHGMIFAFITATPAIVFPNSNGKIKYCYEWLKECEFIHFVESSDTVDQKFIEKVIGSPIDYDLLESKRQSFIDIFRNIFHAS